MRGGSGFHSEISCNYKLFNQNVSLIFFFARVKIDSGWEELFHCRCSSKCNSYTFNFYDFFLNKLKLSHFSQCLAADHFQSRVYDWRTRYLCVMVFLVVTADIFLYCMFCSFFFFCLQCDFVVAGKKHQTSTRSKVHDHARSSGS